MTAYGNVEPVPRLTEGKGSTQPRPVAWNREGERQPSYRASIVLFCANHVVRPMETLEQLLTLVRESNGSFELVVALDGQLLALSQRFEEALRGQAHTKLVHLNTQRGQVGTICAGLAISSGRSIITFPAYPQVDVTSIHAVLEALETGADYVVGYRQKRTDSPLNRVASRIFNGTVRLLTGVSFRDIGCGVHGMRNEVSSSIPNYGDNQLFLPILVAREGFSVRETPVDENTSGPRLRFFTPATLVRRGLDLLTLAYVVRFTQKPLRPFGLLGATFMLAGLILLGILGWQRMFMSVPLAERPLLLFALLLVTTGVQVVILGFLGELLIYLHFRGQTNYRIERRFRSAASGATGPPAGGDESDGDQSDADESDQSDGEDAGRDDPEGDDPSRGLSRRSPRPRTGRTGDDR